MTHTSSKKEELRDLFATEVFDSSGTYETLSLEEQQVVDNAVSKTKYLLAQALKELKEEVIGEVPSKMNTDNWKYDRRVAALKLWQHQAIDNKIKQLEKL